MTQDEKILNVALTNTKKEVASLKGMVTRLRKDYKERTAELELTMISMNDDLRNHWIATVILGVGFFATLIMAIIGLAR